jgi:hypothetical protein
VPRCVGLPDDPLLSVITRRRFLAVGIAGGAALAAAYWWRERPGHAGDPATPAPRTGLGPDAQAVLAAIVPALLDGALPADSAARAEATQETLAAVAVAIDGLPPQSQRELAQLFALLAFAPARIALARVTSPWAQAPTTEVAGFLARWRESGWKLQRSAYDALHQLVFAAWYGNPRSWPAIGYAGPPVLVA